MLYFYIHGFASGRNSSTVQKLEEAIGQPVIALEYASNGNFQDNLMSLFNQINQLTHDVDLTDVMVIGTSLGGFYAIQLANLMMPYVNCVVFNPAVDPFHQLEQFVNQNHTNFSTGETFYFSSETLNSYQNVPEIREIPIVMFVSKTDEVLLNNYELVQEMFGNRVQVVPTETTHRINDFTPYTEVFTTNRFRIW